VILIATLAVAAALTSTAQARAPDFKMSPHRANFGKVTLGATVATTFALKNRSDVPAGISGWNMGALTNIGWKQDASVGGSCISLALARLPLHPGDTCRAELALEPVGVGSFGVRFCLEAYVDPNSGAYPCSIFRGRITEPRQARP
jgi:hypothetical protein